MTTRPHSPVPAHRPPEIVVVGSVALDEIVTLGSPLRTGSHNSGRLEGGRIGGGAANTAMALARAGDCVRVVSAVGEDAEGAQLVSRLRELGVGVGLVQRRAEQTTRSLVLIDTQGERTVVNLARAHVPLPADLAELPADWMYVRSADPALTPVLAQRVARNEGVLAHVPPVRDGFRPAQVLVGSVSDLDEGFLADPFIAGRRIAGETLEWMVITEGSAGARAFGAGGIIEEPAPRVRVVDSTGAGDVFAGGLLHALGRGLPMQQALPVAVSWGAASVSYAGTVPPSGFPAVFPATGGVA
ncbi:MAG: PfkB family carbohydrate kinase [Pseudomonadota bacterium]